VWINIVIFGFCSVLLGAVAPRKPPSKGGSIESQSPTIYGGRTPLSGERIPYMLSKEFDLLIEPR